MIHRYQEELFTFGGNVSKDDLFTLTLESHVTHKANEGDTLKMRDACWL